MDVNQQAAVAALLFSGLSELQQLAPPPPPVQPLPLPLSQLPAGDNVWLQVFKQNPAILKEFLQLATQSLKVEEPRGASPRHPQQELPRLPQIPSEFNFGVCLLFARKTRVRKN